MSLIVANASTHHEDPFEVPFLAKIGEISQESKEQSQKIDMAKFKVSKNLGLKLTDLMVKIKPNLSFVVANASTHHEDSFEV